MDENDIWRLVRQIIEALVYIHTRKIIHRDLVGTIEFAGADVFDLSQLICSLVPIPNQQKPGNVFIDQEGNIRLGDFGLATRHRAKDDLDTDLSEAPADTGPEYDTIEDISRLLGGSAHYTASVSNQTSVQESMTGGVGTTFYRAPEQEGGVSRSAGKHDSSYDSKADIFSLGIMLFEMFHPPFGTVSSWLVVILNSICLLLVY